MSRKFIAVLAAGALAAVPAVAVAKGPANPPAQSHSKAAPHTKKPKTKTFEFKGTFVSYDDAAKTITLAVADKGGQTNKAAKIFRGQNVTVSYDGSKLKLINITDGADAGTDVSLADALTTDTVKVLAKLPVGTTYDAATAYKTKHVYVQRKAADSTPDSSS